MLRHGDKRGVTRGVWPAFAFHFSKSGRPKSASAPHFGIDIDIRYPGYPYSVRIGLLHVENESERLCWARMAG